MKRHLNRLLYFNEQEYTAKKYVIPYIGDVSGLSVLEIGCGDGGNLKAFIDQGCIVTGIDTSENKIKTAKKYLKCCSLYQCSVSKINQKFDIIIIKDTLEHVHFKTIFFRQLKRLAKPDTRIFISFPPWIMPFGGHQQSCDSFLRYIPYVHLLPFYDRLLRLETKREALIEVKQTSLSIRKFKKLVKEFTIEKETYYIINPGYEIKFGLKPLKSPVNIPFLITSYYCLLLNNKFADDESV
jgi:cyclopropane fatty-acyl-phospholipid synthase-like methyltransferase